MYSLLDGVTDPVMIADSLSFEVVFSNKAARKLFSADVTRAVADFLSRKGVETLRQLSSSSLLTIELEGKNFPLTVGQVDEEKLLLHVHYQNSHDCLDGSVFLARRVAHRLNNCLTSIKCHSDLIALNPGDTREVLESVSEINASCLSASELSHELMDLSKEVVKQESPVKVNSLLERWREDFQTLLRDNCTLLIFKDAFADEAVLDQQLLLEVLRSLVQNAVESIPEGEPGRVVVQTSNSGKKVLRVAVLDNGSGVGEGERVFDPYFTTKPRSQGVSLHQARKVARACGWTLDFKSTPGNTGFFIYIDL